MGEEQKEYIVDTIEYYHDLKDMGEVHRADSISIRVGTIILVSGVMITTFVRPITIEILKRLIALYFVGIAIFGFGLSATAFSLLNRINIKKEKKNLIDELDYYARHTREYDIETVKEVRDAIINDDEFKLNDILYKIEYQEEKSRVL